MKALVDQASGAVLKIGPAAIFDGADLAGKLLVDWTGEDADKLCRLEFKAGDFRPDVAQLRQDKKRALADYRDEVLLATRATSFGTFYTDDKSKLLMAGKLLGLLLAERLGFPEPATVTFKTTTGFESFATADFMRAALEVLGGIEGVFAEQQAIEAAIDALEDPEAIRAIAWTPPVVVPAIAQSATKRPKV